MAVVTATDRPKLVRNCCVNEFLVAFCVVTLLCGRSFIIGMSQISSFFSWLHNVLKYKHIVVYELNIKYEFMFVSDIVWNISSYKNFSTWTENDITNDTAVGCGIHNCTETARITVIVEGISHTGYILSFVLRHAALEQIEINWSQCSHLACWTLPCYNIVCELRRQWAYSDSPLQVTSHALYILLHFGEGKSLRPRYLSVLNDFAFQHVCFR